MIKQTMDPKRFIGLTRIVSGECGALQSLAYVVVPKPLRTFGRNASNSPDQHEACIVFCRQFAGEPHLP